MANELLVSNIGRLSSAAGNAEPFMGATTTNNTTLTTSAAITPLSCKYSEEPCEKYRQFINSSPQERTLMIENLVGMVTSYLLFENRNSQMTIFLY